MCVLILNNGMCFSIKDMLRYTLYMYIIVPWKLKINWVSKMIYNDYVFLLSNGLFIPISKIIYYHVCTHAES